MADWPKAKEERLGVIIFQGVNDREDAGNPDAEDSAAVALNILGLKPIKTPIGEVREQSGGFTLAPKAKYTEFRVKFDRFLVEPSKDHQDFSDWEIFEAICETYKYLVLVSCTFERPDASGDNEWEDEVDYFIEPIEISTDEDFDHGSDHYLVTFRQNIF